VIFNFKIQTKRINKNIFFNSFKNKLIYEYSFSRFIKKLKIFIFI
jgi:hypothetical protein